MDLPDLSLLAPLDALLQEGSVSGAARRLGLSTPAMSHALARLRAALGDPLLVRAGRGMALTPRAEAIKDDVHGVVLGASRLLVPAPAVEPAALSRSFVVHASDYVLRLLGAGVDAALGAALPRATLRFLPNSPDDPAMLREGGSDLAVGIYGALPDEMRSRPLLTDRFVVVARAAHPLAAAPLTLEAYLGAAHLQVAPRGLPGGYVDDVLRALGHSRAVTRAVPYFLVGAALASEADLLLTLPERLARLVAPGLGLVLLEAPLPLRPYALSLVWHPRLDGDPAHRLLREAFVRAAAAAAAQRHPDARTRLDPSDPTSGEGRRRPPKAPTLQQMKG
jgi:DNA-binding transcriptional LysR family regulator